MYTADLVSLIKQHCLSPHLYADDTQIYGVCAPSDVGPMLQCYGVSEIRCRLDVGQSAPAERLRGVFTTRRYINSQQHPSSNPSFLHLSLAAWIIASLLISLPLIHIQRLQSVQNATARLIFYYSKLVFYS